jgi:hypothetical protein
VIEVDLDVLEKNEKDSEDIDWLDWNIIKIFLSHG